MNLRTVELKPIKATPVFFKNLEAYKGPAPIICNEGGSRCFHADTMVHTTTGLKKISEIKPGEQVFTSTGQSVVNDVFVNKNTKKCIKIKLKNGNEIQVTDDHKFMFRQGWHDIKYIVSLWHENNTKL